jgi:putative tricarboxylic transport membrane protein
LLEMLMQGFANVLDPGNFVFLVGGVMLGLIMGAIPGMTSTMAIALLIPMTFYMDPVRSMIMLLGTYNGGIFGGSISAVLLSAPGTPASAATVADGFQLARQGKAGKALKAALFASVQGCMFSTVILILIAQPIARFALAFGPAEYAVMMLFSITIIGSAAGKSFVKGLIGGALGLLFSFVGMDIITGTPRFDFGLDDLGSGIDLVVMLIGLLAVSEILVQLEGIILNKGAEKESHLPPPKHPNDSRFSWKEYKSCFKTIMRSSVIGLVIGALPALGPTLAAYLGYDAAKRASKHPEQFGKGAIEGVVAPEAANNAVCGANLIPLLAFGVPGDTVAAILIGAFLIQGITPGPLIFREAPNVVAGIYTGLIISNLILLVMALATFRFFTKITHLPKNIIFPSILLFCLAGVYALNQNAFDVWLMIFFSVIGYLMLKFEFTPATMLIGFILGPLFEKNFRQALLISGGDIGIFFRTPITWGLWAITIFSILAIARQVYRDHKQGKENDKAETAQ